MKKKKSITEAPLLEKPKKRRMTTVAQKEAKKNYYVDPKDFQASVLDYHTTDVMSELLAQSIFDIANRFSFAPNFINYTYKEDMIGDAIIKMITAVKNKKFNPEKGKAFSYFSMITHNAFCNRIKKEKRAREVLTNYQNDIYDRLIEDGYIDDERSKEEEGSIEEAKSE